MGFRSLRQKNKSIDLAEIEEVLRSEPYGVLATTDNQGYPYASPSVFYYNNNRIYLHCGYKGHKVENITYNNRVSFCVVEESPHEDNPMEGDYRSVVAFGRARSIQDADERMRIFVRLSEKYGTMHKVENPEYVKKLDGVTQVVCIDVEHMTGKVIK